MTSFPIRALVLAGITIAAGCGGRQPAPVAPAATESEGPRELVVDDDGSAPYRRIGDALAAASSGDTVRVLAGTYHEFVELRSGVAIVGAGRDQTTVEYDRGNAVVVGRDVHGVSLSGLRLEHERGEAPCGSPVVLCVGCRDFTIRDSEILGSGYEGVLLNHATRVRIDGSRIAENEWTGVEVLRSSDVEIVDSEFVDNPVSLAIAGSTVRAESSMLGTGFTRAPAVVAAMPARATTLTVVRCEFGTPIVDFTHGGFRQVGLEGVDTGFLQTAVEVREIIAPPDEDHESDDPVDDWMHNALVAWNEPHGLGLGVSRHVGYIRRDGSFDDTLPPPPDSTYNGGRPVGGPVPTAADAGRFTGTWEGGNDDASFTLVLRDESGRLAGTLTIDGGVTFECVGQEVDRGAEARGPVMAFRCTEDGGDETVAHETRCVLTLTEAGGLAAHTSSTPGCDLEGTMLGRRP